MLPCVYRLYFWGVNGIFLELMFTALWKSDTTRFTGVYTICAFLVYGLGTLLLAESARTIMIGFRFAMMTRALGYVVMILTCELIGGAFLDLFEARPWNYSQFTYNYKGLITMEYIPLWYFVGMYFECIIFLMKRLKPIPKRMRMVPEESDDDIVARHFHFDCYGHACYEAE